MCGAKRQNFFDISKMVFSLGVYVKLLRQEGLVKKRAIAAFQWRNFGDKSCLIA
jgi:hypothetical protein